MENTKNSNGKTQRQLSEEISLFIQYGINELEKKTAEATLKIHGENLMALKVLKDFYSRLPELRQEAVGAIFKIVSRQGMYLIGVQTKNFEYLYFYNGEEPFYLGEKKDGIGESEILTFFGYASNEDFLKQQSSSPVLPINSDKDKEGNAFCPACSVTEGEIHRLGCPVEVCPWCEGQLNYCNCRFDKLGLEEIVSDDQLDRLEILLNEKGRVPFSREQGPSYPEGGSGQPLSE